MLQLIEVLPQTLDPVGLPPLQYRGGYRSQMHRTWCFPWFRSQTFCQSLSQSRRCLGHCSWRGNQHKEFSDLQEIICWRALSWFLGLKGNRRLSLVWCLGQLQTTGHRIGKTNPCCGHTNPWCNHCVRKSRQSSLSSLPGLNSSRLASFSSSKSISHS